MDYRPVHFRTGSKSSYRQPDKEFKDGVTYLRTFKL